MAEVSQDETVTVPLDALCRFIRAAYCSTMVDTLPSVLQVFPRVADRLYEMAGESTAAMIGRPVADVVAEARARAAADLYGQPIPSGS